MCKNIDLYSKIYIYAKRSTHSFNKYLRSAHCMIGTVLSVFDLSMNKNKEDACPSGTQIVIEDKAIKQ